MAAHPPMGGAVACRSGGRLVPAALVWAGISGRARPSFSSGRSLGTALEAGECPGARRPPEAAEQGWGLGGWGLGAANGAPEACVSAGAGVVTATLTLGVLRDSPARGGGGQAGRLYSPQSESLLCARPGRGPRWRPRADSVDGETEARFGTSHALTPESSPSVPRPQMTASLLSLVKTADQRYGLGLAEADAWGETDVSAHGALGRYCVWN